MSGWYLHKHPLVKKSISLLNIFTLAMTMLLTGLPALSLKGAVRPAMAALPAEVQVTTDTANQGQPRIDGDKIVYSDDRNGNYDIYMYDITTGEETRITTSPANQTAPDISGDVIVYQDDRNGNQDIFMYDLNSMTEATVTANGALQEKPAVSGNHIVWRDLRAGAAPFSDIYMYEIGGAESQLTTSALNYRDEPAISGDNVVWNEMNAGWDIYTHNISSGVQRQVTTDTAHQYYSDIDGDKVVYLDNRAGEGIYRVYMHNLTTDVESLVATNAMNDSYPEISGDKVVWQDQLSISGIADIYLRDMTTGEERALTNDSYSQVSPAVANGVAVWQDNINGNSDIYMLGLDPVPVTTILADGAPPTGDWYTTTPTISLAPDETATPFYSWDGGGETAYAGSFEALSGEHVLSYYSVGENGQTEAIKNQEFKVDTEAPTDPELSSSSHATGTPSNDPTIDIDISGATDATSGVEGYSVLWSPDSTTPLPAVSMISDGGFDTTTSEALPDGQWWFNLSTKDFAGNWTNTAHIGPFTIDTSAPASYFMAPDDGDSFIRPETVDLSGASADNIGGAGLADTLLTIQRLSDGAYWDGSDWGGFANIGLGSGGLWDYSIPAGALTQDGPYMATVSAVDVAGNVQPGPSIVTFNYFGGSVTPSVGLAVLTQDTSDALAARVVRASVPATDPLAADLESGYSAGTTLTVELNVGPTRQALSVLAHGDPVGWSQTGSTVTVEAKTISYKPSTGTPGFELASALEFVVVFAGDPRLQGSWFASNASEQNVPIPDLSDLDSLRMQVTGVSGVSGWAKAFIPAATMAAWGVADPEFLSAEIDGVQTTPTVTAVAGGHIMSIDLGYSSHVLRYGKDRVAPTGGSLSINSGAANTKSGAVTLSVGAAVDPGSGVDQIGLSNDNVTWSWVSYGAAKPWTLGAGDGNRTVWVKYKDAAGNVGPAVSDTILKDTIAPTATMVATNISTNVSKTKIFPVSWSGGDALPSSGGPLYDVQVKTNSGAWTAWKTGVAAGSANFSGAPGSTYYFKARARDAAGNTAYSAESKTIVPLDQSKGVKRVGFAGTISKASSNYYLGTVRYSTTKGDEITYSFTGNHFALIGTKGPKYSKAVVIIDGVKKTIDARAGSLKVRQVLMEKSLTMKKHTVKIRNLGTAGRTRFEIDGVGVGR